MTGRSFSPQMASSLRGLAPRLEWWKDRFRWDCLPECLLVAYSARQPQDGCTHSVFQGYRSIPRGQGESCKALYDNFRSYIASLQCTVLIKPVSESTLIQGEEAYISPLDGRRVK